MAPNPSLAERLTVLEVKIEHMEAQHALLDTSIKDISDKLDELLVLRHKGTGAFWAATTLFGISLVSLGNQVFTWFKALVHVP